MKSTGIATPPPGRVADPGGLAPVAHGDGRGRGSATAAACIALATSGAVVSTPLFPAYAKTWDLSSLTTTTVYAAYIIGTLTALIGFGRLSDRVGRKPMLLAGLGLAAFGTLILLVAPSVAWLFPGRVLQGLTIGVISSTASAALADITRDAARAAMLATASNVGGMAFGTLFAGVIAQYLPWPLRLPYCVYLVVLAVVAIATLRLREPKKPAAEEHAAAGVEEGPRARVPVAAFATAAATTLVGFSSVALMLSLGPKLTLQWAGSDNFALGALPTCITCLAAGVTQLLARAVRPRLGIVVGMVLLVAGVAALLGAGAAKLLPLLFLAALLIGVGYGFVFLGGLSGTQRIIPPARRATWLSMYYITAYVGMSVPAIGTGFLTDSLGLLAAVEIFAVYIAILALAITVATVVQPRLDGRASP